MAVVTPLYGHVSPETAYLIEDYPYGRKVRCRIRYWIEQHPRHGWRFVSQTEHPVGKYWNTPKKGTYVPFGAAMYLDEQGYVQWTSAGRSPDTVLSFVRSFPGAPCLRDLHHLAEYGAKHADKGARGEIQWVVNGVTQPVAEVERARYATEAEAWRKVLGAFGGAGPTIPAPPPDSEGAGESAQPSP